MITMLLCHSTTTNLVVSIVFIELSASVMAANTKDFA